MKEVFSCVVCFWIVLVVCSSAIDGCRGKRTYEPPAASAPQYSDTERALKRSYDDAGIEYDEKMIRDDARAIEQLNRELGN